MKQNNSSNRELRRSTSYHARKQHFYADPKKIQQSPTMKNSPIKPKQIYIQQINEHKQEQQQQKQNFIIEHPSSDENTYPKEFPKENQRITQRSSFVESKNICRFPKKPTHMPKNNLRNILRTNFQENQQKIAKDLMTQQQIEAEIENEKARKEITELTEIPLQYQDLEMYLITKNLGQGATAEVKLARHKVLDINIAMKIYDKKKMSAQSQKNLQREIEILYKMNHPNVIRLYHVIDGQRHIHLAMEYTSPTCLDTFMRGRPFKRVTEEEAKIIFKQIVEAICYLHGLNIMHRDLKLENVLVDYTTKKIKLIDFGYSVQVHGNEKLTTSCGTPSYMSPEIVKQSYYSFPSDVWSCGIILFKIITGVFPYRGNSEKDLFKKITTSKLEFPSFLSNSSKNLITQILKQDQNERPTIFDVAQHPWFD